VTLTDDRLTEAGAGPGSEIADTRLREKEWFIAIDEVDVGPVDMLAIEGRWNAGEVTAESLAWRPGMPDWQPIADVPDLLSFLRRNRDLARVEPPAPILWKSDFALSLSELVAHELTVEKRQAPLAEPPPAGATLGLPDLGNLGFGAQATWEKSWGMPASEPWTPAPTPWLRASESSRSHHTALMLMAVGMAALIIALGVILAVLLKQPTLVARKEPPGQTTTGAATPPLVKPAIALPALTPIVQTAEAPPTESTALTTPSPKPVARDRAAKPRRPSTPSRPAESAAHGGSELSADEILAAVKENAASLVPCVRAARAKNELAPGKIKLILAWNIDRSGAVRDPQLVGPPSVLGGSLPGCFAVRMRGWVFRASSDTSTVRNFPLPLNVR
jgi:hypothetical protein